MKLAKNTFKSIGLFIILCLPMITLSTKEDNNKQFMTTGLPGSGGHNDSPLYFNRDGSSFNTFRPINKDALRQTLPNTQIFGSREENEDIIEDEKILNRKTPLKEILNKKPKTPPVPKAIEAPVPQNEGIITDSGRPNQAMYPIKYPTAEVLNFGVRLNQLEQDGTRADATKHMHYVKHMIREKNRRLREQHHAAERTMHRHIPRVPHLNKEIIHHKKHASEHHGHEKKHKPHHSKSHSLKNIKGFPSRRSFYDPPSHDCYQICDQLADEMGCKTTPTNNNLGHLVCKCSDSVKTRTVRDFCSSGGKICKRSVRWGVCGNAGFTGRRRK